MNNFAIMAATLLDHFNNDFSSTLGLGGRYDMQDQNTKKPYQIEEQVRHDLSSSIRTFTYYIPEISSVTPVILGIINNLPKAIDAVSGMMAKAGTNGDFEIGPYTIVYSNRIYIYCENDISDLDIERIQNGANSKGVFITVRNKKYLAYKAAIETPLAFISHDSRDKDLIAGPLAHALSSRLCPVWYDEYSLKIGDSLRLSIEKGIRDAK